MPGFSATALNTGVAAQDAAATFVSLHTADPGTTGANEVAGGSYVRVATVWGSASGGAVTGSQVSIVVPTGTTVTHAGLWTTSTAGTFYASCQLPSPQSFPSGGTLQVTPTISAAG